MSQSQTYLHRMTAFDEGCCQVHVSLSLTDVEPLREYFAFSASIKYIFTLYDA